MSQNDDPPRKSTSTDPGIGIAPSTPPATAPSPSPSPSPEAEVDSLLDAIGAQDKPHPPRRTVTSGGASAAAYEGPARSVRPGRSNDDAPTASVILSPSQPPPALEQGRPRTEPPSRGFDDSRDRQPPTVREPDARSNQTVVVDLRESSRRIAQWGLAGVVVALLLMALAWLKAQSDAPSVPPTRASDPHAAAPPDTPATAEPMAAPPVPPEQTPPLEAAPVETAVAPEPSASARMRHRVRPLGAHDEPRPAAVPVPTPTRKPSAPGLEDLKTDY